MHTICDLDPLQLQKYRSPYPDVRLTDSYREILENPEIRKVAIATPTASHFDLAKRALEAGKDVFVEKAMCSTSEEALFLAETAQREGAILMVGHILQYHPCLIRIKEMIRSGKLGRLLHLQFNRLNFGSVGAETSALMAFAPHDISILMEFCKPLEPEEVRCDGRSFFAEQSVDQSRIRFSFSENVGADIYVNWLHPVPERTMTIVGSEGTLIFDDMKEWSEKITFWKNTVSEKGGRLCFHRSKGEALPIEPKEPLAEEVKAFLEACRTRRAPITDGFEGYRVIRMLNVAQESERTGMPVILDTNLRKTVAR